jgi:hypothetical protein
MKAIIDLPEELTTGTSAKVRRTCEADLSSDELAYAKREARHIKTIWRLASCMSDWAKENGHGTVDYSRPMLGRIIKSVGDSLGIHGDEFKELIQLGYNIQSKGGTFEYKVGEDNTLQSFVVQTKLMAEYAEAYADFSLMDGTHCINRYGEILVPTCVVDALGRTKITSIIMVDSENSEDLLELCGHLTHCLRKGSTFMTDEGPAFPIIADTLGLNHILCVDHFATSIFSGCAGLGAMASDFIKDMSRALYNDLESPKNLEIHLGVMLLTYQTPQATALIKRVDAVKSQVCFTYTKQHFTASHKATQRSEGVNSDIKEQGDAKKDLAKMNNYRFMEHLLTMAERKDLDAVADILQLILSGAKWSKFVQERWQDAQQSCASIVECTKVRVDTDLDGKGKGTIWSVKSRKGDNFEDHIVRTWINHDAPNAKSRYPPRCDCCSFCSSLIPCSHICRVLTCSKNNLFCESNLEERWRLSSLPLYKHAASKVNASLIKDQQHGQTLEVIHTGVGAVPMKEYRDTHWDDKAHRRANQAKRACMELADAITKAPMHAFKVGILGVGLLKNVVRQAEQCNGKQPMALDVVGTSLQPKAKKTKTAKDCDDALQILNEMRGKPRAKKPSGSRVGGCTACIKHGIIPADSHRSGSSNCQFRNCVCEKCIPAKSIKKSIQQV